MTKVTSCKPVSHVMEQPNDRVWQTVRKQIGSFHRAENLQHSCSFGEQRQEKNQINSMCSEIHFIAQNGDCNHFLKLDYNWACRAQEIYKVCRGRRHSRKQLWFPGLLPRRGKMYMEGMNFPVLCLYQQSKRLLRILLNPSWKKNRFILTH